MKKSKKSVFKTGEKLGWMMAMGFEATRHVGALKRDKKAFYGQVKEYLKTQQPHHTPMEKDALRHAFVSAKMTQKHGPAFAAFLGYCNESVRDVTLANNQGDRGMDLYNNAVGRKIVADHPDILDEDLLDKLWGHAQDGGLIVSPEDPRALSHTYAQETHVTAEFFENIMKYSNKAARFKPFNLF